ncbi:MAG: SPFH domain-containing protein [Saprospiraceae bacterium]|jgi:regulator of protease activity HflC (stomatin/prohibitin superfamily)|uniref:SPFH domain-containing protein n=1 Tax=Candidatus Brachybacter algidus TaxID=2982024 RepID=UPI001B3FB1C7|nr:SPFH domain-containing protein [Candidatus Brachybacter algidus]MBP7307123.1 SPFH domain-containing protein [Saprospiraceae bacterium]MBK6375030.1 SPFH domain-containing protein [Candidatus Brachybacter algidus]MBK6450099.1 SPFH domain-containing protein [Candidatus Brachybacter algidus]MBK7605217.1 SPFH domain-containing protein [Candidatus Brachybacter algidus]MBK8356111.1 SPFH domain-containing protein [Candidatus Brachybacter algidus]
MLKEKLIKPISGFIMILFLAVLVAATIYLAANEIFPPQFLIISGVLFFFLVPGFKIVNPNEAIALIFFGKYVGTIKENGFFWVNPFYISKKLSLRARNLNGEKLKVNDGVGNPIEIAAVIVWKVSDTFKALYEVDDYVNFVRIQSEAAIRVLANKYPYDQFEDENADLTLLSGAEKVNEELEKALHDRLESAGIVIIEARISHLAYAQEIAGAMLQRQQAIAIVAARKKIVEGAVGMVDLALTKLQEGKIVDFDEHSKAAMVSNLMVVLCSDRSAHPVINAGTLNH